MPTRDRLKKLDEFTLADLEAVRLILRGDSVIDWHRLNFENDEEIRGLPRSRRSSTPTSPPTARGMDAIKNEAISYLRRHFEYPIPKPVEQAHASRSSSCSPRASGHRQMCACTILKCMHIIHHLEGRELLFVLPLSDQEVFHVVEEKVYRVIGSMLAGGFPITEFVGGRKNKDSLYTKLLSKQDTVAAQIYDKLRFRIVTRSSATTSSRSSSTCRRSSSRSTTSSPAQSINSMFHFKQLLQQERRTCSRCCARCRRGADDELTPSDNSFIGGRVPGHPLRRRHARAPAARSCSSARRRRGVAARADHLRHLRVPGHRPRDRGGERARRGVARQVQGAAEAAPSCGGSSSACAR